MNQDKFKFKWWRYFGLVILIGCKIGHFYGMVKDTIEMSAIISIIPVISIFAIISFIRRSVIV